MTWNMPIRFITVGLVHELGLSIEIPEGMRNTSIGQPLPRDAYHDVGHLVALLFESSLELFKFNYDGYVGKVVIVPNLRES